MDVKGGHEMDHQQDLMLLQEEDEDALPLKTTTTTDSNTTTSNATTSTTMTCPPFHSSLLIQDHHPHSNSPPPPHHHPIFSSRYYALFISAFCIFTDSITYGFLMLFLPTLTRLAIQVVPPPPPPPLHNHLPDVGMGVAAVVVVVDETVIDFYLAVLYSIYATGLFITTPLVGILSDKYNNRKVPLLLGSILQLAAFGFYIFDDSFVSLILARLFQGISSAFSWVLCWAVVAEIFPVSNIGFAMGIVVCSNIVGSVVGPLLSNFIILEEIVQFRIPFYIISGLILVQLFVLLLFKPIPIIPMTPLGPSPVVLDNNRQYSFWKWLGKQKLFSLWTHRIVVLESIAVILSSMSLSMIESLLSNFIQTSFGVDVQVTGYIMLALILPDVIASVCIGYLSDFVNCNYLILFGFIVHSFGAIMLGFSGNIATDVGTVSLPFFIFALVFFSVSLSFIMTPCIPLMATSLLSIQETSSYARIYSIYNLCYSFGMIIGPYIGLYFLSWTNSFFAMTFIFPFLSLIFVPIYIWNLWRFRKKGKDKDLLALVPSEDNLPNEKASPPPPPPPPPLPV